MKMYQPTIIAMHVLLGVQLAACEGDYAGGEEETEAQESGSKVAEELAADLKLCTEDNAAQDAVDCARDLLSAFEKVSPRCGNNLPPKPTCDKYGVCKIPAPKAEEP